MDLTSGMAFPRALGNPHALDAHGPLLPHRIGAAQHRTADPPEGWLGGRLRAMLPWASAVDDPVTGLLRTHRQVHPRADTAPLRKGYAIAERMHRGQMRKSGEEYITHPVAVAQILAELGMDTTTLVAALLHDTVEDTAYTLPELATDFGAEVALLVDGVTKFDKVYFGASAEAETIRKMLLRAGDDVRVLVIKLADRLHNMRTLDARSPAARTRIAKATNDVLVPLCDRLGIQALKRELEDTVLWALEPDWFERINGYFRAGSPWASLLAEVIGEVGPALARERVDASVEPRPRHHYSLWKDTRASGQDEPHDLPRILIVVDGPATDCYAALGAVHTTYRPVVGRFKDFIAAPKNNLYRSLHTTVLGPGRQPVEVLIRTEAMHREAEYGIVANFRFAESPAPSPARQDQLTWLTRVLDWQREATDAERFLDALRCDLSEGQIHVFTSDGHPVLLPAGSTPVDLAYMLRIDTGHGCIGARRAGRLIPLSSQLADGDVVEVISQPQPHAGPSREWLAFVRTPVARLHINRWFDGEQEPAATAAHRVAAGRGAIAAALRVHDRSLLSDAPLVTLANELGYPDVESLAVAVSDGLLAAAEVADRLVGTVDRLNH